MKVIVPPWIFKTGGYLLPQRLNENFQHIKILNDQCLERRYCHDIVVLPFHITAGTPLTNASPAALKKFKFVPSMDGVVESLQIHFVGTGTGTVTLSPLVGGVAVTGYNDLEISLSASSDTYSDISSQPISVLGGQSLEVVLAGASFTCTQCWVSILYKTDRFTPLGVNLETGFSPSMYQPRQSVDATQLNVIDLANALTAATNNTAANVSKGNRLESYSLYNFTSATTAPKRKRRLPSINNSLGSKDIASGRIEAKVDVTTGCTVNFSLVHVSGAPTIFTQSLVIGAGLDFAEASISFTSTSLDGASFDSSNPAQDFILQVTCATAAVTVQRATVELTYE